jgi:hypothetical protein
MLSLRTFYRQASLLYGQALAISNIVFFLTLVLQPAGRRTALRGKVLRGAVLGAWLCFLYRLLGLCFAFFTTPTWG